VELEVEAVSMQAIEGGRDAGRFPAAARPAVIE
jgi:hypothetical protein